MTTWNISRVSVCLILSMVFAASAIAAKPPGAEEKAGKKADLDKRSRDAREQSEKLDVEEVMLFEAMENKQIDAFVVARNFSLLTLSLRNKTAAPLRVRAPDVFAAIPASRVAAMQMARMRGNQSGRRTFGPQFGYGYGPSNGNSAQGGGGSQGLGGAFYNLEPIKQLTRGDQSEESSMADARDDAQTRTGLPSWLLPPGRVLTQPLPCFCLEFGKPDPSRRIPYVLRPLKELNQDPVVHELLLMFGHKRVTQRVTQIALWHAGNQVPWQMLAKVELPRSQAGAQRKFSVQELQAANTLIRSLPSYRDRFQGGMNPGIQ